RATDLVGLHEAGPGGSTAARVRATCRSGLGATPRGFEDWKARVLGNALGSRDVVSARDGAARRPAGKESDRPEPFLHAASQLTPSQLTVFSRRRRTGRWAEPEGRAPLAPSAMGMQIPHRPGRSLLQSLQPRLRSPSKTAS